MQILSTLFPLKAFFRERDSYKRRAHGGGMEGRITPSVTQQKYTRRRRQAQHEFLL